MSVLSLNITASSHPAAVDTAISIVKKAHATNHAPSTHSIRAVGGHVFNFHLTLTNDDASADSDTFAQYLVSLPNVDAIKTLD